MSVPFLAARAKRLKPRTYIEIERHVLANAKPLHGLSIAGIQRRDIAELLSSIDSDSVRNHVRVRIGAYVFLLVGVTVCAWTHALDSFWNSAGDSEAIFPCGKSGCIF